MSEPGDIEERVNALEGEVEDLKRRVRRSEEDASAARVLAGGADRDVGEFRAELRDFREQNNRLHNATRADIADLRADNAELRGDTATLRSDNAEFRTTFAEIRANFDMLAAGQHQIVTLLNQVIDDRS